MVAPPLVPATAMVAQAAAPSGPAGQATPATASGDAAATPAEQLLPALVSFAIADGSQQVSVQLRPAELGRVQISVGRAADGSSSVDVTADRPETLALLQRDQSQLQGALDQAGIAREGRSLTFSLAGSSSPSNGETAGGPAAATAANAMTNETARQVAAMPAPAQTAQAAAPDLAHAHAAASDQATGAAAQASLSGGGAEPHARAATMEAPSAGLASTDGGAGGGRDQRGGGPAPSDAGLADPGDDAPASLVQAADYASGRLDITA